MPILFQLHLWGWGRGCWGVYLTKLYVLTAVNVLPLIAIKCGC